jgi:hypothetical protein
VSAASEADGEMGTKLLVQVIRLIFMYVCMVAMSIQVVTFKIISNFYNIYLYLFDNNIVFYCISVGKAINVTRAGAAGCCLPHAEFEAARLCSIGRCLSTEGSLLRINKQHHRGEWGVHFYASREERAKLGWWPAK